jgi:hypothetical protein
MASISGRNLPPPQSPFVDKATGILSYDGYQFLLDLLNNSTSSLAQKSVKLGLVATGANQATALQLAAQWNEVDTTPAGSGVLLASYQSGQSQVVFNGGANALNVYPPPGAQINALGANQPYSLASGAKLSFDFFSATQIRT